MVTPRLRALERASKNADRAGNARSGMVRRGRVQSVDLVTVTCVVQTYGRGGQVARLNNVGIIGFPNAADLAALRGEDVILLFPNGKAGAGEAWILGVVARPVSLYDSLVSEITGSASIVDRQRVIAGRREDVQVVSNVSASDREVTIAAFELAADSLQDVSAMQAKIGAAVYQSFTIEADVRRATSGQSIGSEAPLTVLAPTGAPFRVTIQANTQEDLTVTLSAVRSAGEGTGSYRVFTGGGASSGTVFSPKEPTQEHPLIRIRGRVDII